MEGLSSRQRRAAQLIGHGRLQREAATEVGVHTGTVKRWAARRDFRKAVDQARAALLKENPGPQATLETALTATRRDGSPDWQSRITAARALLGREPEGDSPAEKVRETVIHMDRIKGRGQVTRLLERVKRAIANEKPETGLIVRAGGQTVASRPALPGGSAVLIDLDHKPRSVVVNGKLDANRTPSKDRESPQASEPAGPTPSARSSP